MRGCCPEQTATSDWKMVLSICGGGREGGVSVSGVWGIWDMRGVGGRGVGYGWVHREGTRGRRGGAGEGEGDGDGL